jgi:hypothetical protein
MRPSRILAFALLVVDLPVAARAQYRRLGYGEPYELAAGRMVFTSWYWVRQGHFDWVDDEGKTVFAKRLVNSLLGDPHTHWKELDISATRSRFTSRWNAPGLTASTLSHWMNACAYSDRRCGLSMKAQPPSLTTE